MNRKPKSLKQMLIKAVVSSVAGTAMMGCALFISSQQPMTATPVAPEQGSNAQPVQTEKPLANILVETKCRDYVEGSIPGHAVVTLPGHKAQYVKSDVGFALWGPDEKPATADDRPGMLHAFCL